MADIIKINNYSKTTSQKIRELIQKYSPGTWLTDHGDELFQICDELIKNAVKSNYRFVLQWLISRQKFMKENPELNSEEIDEKLYSIFFSGETARLEQHLDQLGTKKEIIRSRVRELLDMEGVYGKYKDTIQNHPELTDALGDDFDPMAINPLIKIKKLAKDLEIRIHFHIESTPDELIVMVANDSPMAEEDLEKINKIRDKFKEYHEKDREMEFFVEHMDTSGGGAGLGYAIMDAILYQLNLNPAETLFVVAATRTLILLSIPFQKKLAAQSESLHSQPPVAHQS